MIASLLYEEALALSFSTLSSLLKSTIKVPRLEADQQ